MSEESDAFEKFAWLREYARGFEVDADDIEVISTPDQFYQTLKVCTRFVLLLLLGFIHFHSHFAAESAEQVHKAHGHLVTLSWLGSAGKRARIGTFTLYAYIYSYRSMSVENTIV